jgi:hypothetical protein
MNVLEYGVKLTDQMSSPAKAAATSADQLASSLKKAKTDLGAFQSQLSKAKQLGDVDGYKKYSQLVDGARTSVFVLTQETEKLGDASAHAKGGISGIVGELGELAGPIGAVLAGATAVVGSFAALTIAGASLALEQGELREELESTFEALSGGPEAGKATIDLLNDLSKELPQSRKQLAEWTKQYEALGITDLGQLRGQIEATANAQAIMGETGAAAYENISKKVQEAIDTHHGLKIADKALASLAQTGANVSDVANELGESATQLRDELTKGTVDAGAFGDALERAIVKKGVGPLKNLAGDMATISTKAHENFGRLFDDVDASPFTSQLSSITHLLDDGTPSAMALKAGIKVFLDEVFEVSGKALPVLKHFFLDLEIAGLRTYIVAKPLIKEFESLGLTSGGIGALATSFKALTGWIELSLGGTIKIVTAMVKLTELAIQLTGITGGKEVGAQSAEGFIGGVKDGKGRAQNAGADLAEGAKAGVVKTLDIHSPSRVGFKLGRYFDQGIAGGMTNGGASPAAASSLAQRTVSATAYGGAESIADASPYASGGGSKSVSVHIDKIEINGAGKDAQQITELMVATTFERLANQEGAL